MSRFSFTDLITLPWNQVLHRRPLLASCKLTYRCNLTCRQCPFYQMEGKDPTYEEVLHTLDTLQARGSRLIIFEGGEPMLWRDHDRNIHDVVRAARDRFAAVGMTTNGTLPLDVETDILWVSVDGFRETHNTLRCADVFERIIANLRASSHPRCYAHVTVNNVNHRQIPELVQFLAGMTSGVTIQFYYPYNQQDDLFLPFAERAHLLDELIALKRSGLPILNSIPALRALKYNTWCCSDWLIDNANPDGSLAQGCYLKGRADIDCSRCGFSPHTEASLAFRGNPAAILAGLRIFM
jgi:Fe-coproporphyrin III synthase